MQLVIDNQRNGPAYYHFKNMQGDGDFVQVTNAKFVPDKLNETSGGVAVTRHYEISPLTTATFEMKSHFTYESGTVWSDSRGDRTWELDSYDPGGPKCTQAEVNVLPNDVWFDITQLEGLCSGVQIAMTNGTEHVDQVTCGLSKDRVQTTERRGIASDKYVSNEIWRANAGCEVSEMSKKCCHKFMAKHSYDGGFCNALLDAGCEAYCWAYDEKRCMNADTCQFDAQCNPPDNPKRALRTHPREDNSIVYVTITDLDENTRRTILNNMPSNYGKSGDFVKCANPGACTDAANNGSWHDNMTLIIVAALALILCGFCFYITR